MRALLIAVSLVLVVAAAGIGVLALSPAPQTNDSMTLVIETGSISSQRTAQTDAAEQPTAAVDTSAAQAEADTAETRRQPTLDEVIAARLEQAGRRPQTSDPDTESSAETAARSTDQATETRPQTQANPAARSDSQANPAARSDSDETDFTGATNAETPAGTVSITEMLAAELNADDAPDTAAEERAATTDVADGAAEQASAGQSASPTAETAGEPTASREANANTGSSSEMNVAALPPGMAIQPGAAPGTANPDDASRSEGPPSAITEDSGVSAEVTEGQPDMQGTPLAAGEGPDLPAQRGAFRVKGRIAMVIRGLGVNGDLTARAIEAMPRQVALGFVPYGEDLTDWTRRARQGGHEVLIQIPLEPKNYPENNPGPHTLLTSLSIDENLERLDWLLDRFEGVTGVSNYLGGKFAKAPGAFAPVLMELKARELIYVDDGNAATPTARQLARQVSLAYAVADSVVDEPRREPAKVSEALKRIEAVARSEGKAIAIGHAHAETLATLKDWIAGLSEKGLVLEPVSSLLAAPDARQVSQTTDG